MLLYCQVFIVNKLNVNRKTEVSWRCSTTGPVALVSKESQVSRCFGEGVWPQLLVQALLVAVFAAYFA